jgi:hypothetical protein
VRHLYRAALGASLVGLIASLIVHVRSLMGVGFYHWFAPFGLIFILFVPYLFACEGIVHGGMLGFRKDSTEPRDPGRSRDSGLGLDSIEYLQRWRIALARRPTWLRTLNYIVLFYFMTTFVICFIFQVQHDQLSNIFSLRMLPSSTAFLLSSGWVLCYWVLFSTFWQVIYRS